MTHDQRQNAKGNNPDLERLFSALDIKRHHDTTRIGNGIIKSLSDGYWNFIRIAGENAGPRNCRPQIGISAQKFVDDARREWLSPRTPGY